MNFSLQEADKTFEKFFKEHGILTKQEENFFNRHFPEQTKNYYNILGVSRYATINEINDAYRKLAIRYHPKNNPNSHQTQKKFLEINQAYNVLSNQINRRSHDETLFGRVDSSRVHHDVFVQPTRVQNSFQDKFFGSKWNEFPEKDQFFKGEDEFFKPMMSRPFGRGFDNLMENDRDFGSINTGSSIKKSTVYQNNNGVESKKIVSSKKVVKDGKTVEQTTEQFTLPTGQKQITKTIRDGDSVSTKKFLLRKGEEYIRQLDY